MSVVQAAEARLLAATGLAGRLSTTRLWLRWQRGGLLGGSVALFGVSLAALAGVQGTVSTVRDRTVPAIVEVSAAQVALVAANQAALDSFRTGRGKLTGPGTDYQNQLAVASQSLAELAQDNVAEEAGQQLQLVEGLLVSYTGMVEVADADYQSEDGSVRHIGGAAVALWGAWSLLHTQILPTLDRLRTMEETAFSKELSTGWIAPALIPLWAAPAAALLAMLVATQVFLARRFRRLLNPPLIAATALLLVAAGGLVGLVGSHARLDGAREALSPVVLRWTVQASATDAIAMAALLQPCSSPTGACGRQVDQLLDGTSGASPSTPIGSMPVPAGIAAVDRQTAAADPGTLRLAGVPACALLVAILAMWGLQPFVDQYRYRQR